MENEYFNGFDGLCKGKKAKWNKYDRDTSEIGTKFGKIGVIFKAVVLSCLVVSVAYAGCQAACCANGQFIMSAWAAPDFCWLTENEMYLFCMCLFGS